MHYLKLLAELKVRLKAKSEALKNLLAEYQPFDVTGYEIERCIRTIDGIGENSAYLNGKQSIDSIAIMLPSNLPLYSLLIFAIIPSFLSKSVNVRPNSILQELNLISRIYDELELDNLFPNVGVVNEEHAGFEKYIRNANLVIFTGKPSNAEKFLKLMKQDSLLVINGAGHNPVVVTETANIEEAVKGTTLLKGFNSGQDCAGPDAILVHHTIAEKFIEQFQQAFSRLPAGACNDPNTIIGPIHRLSELQRLMMLIHQNKKDILSGGIINLNTSQIIPTIIVRGIERYPNFKEVYGPVAFIHPYKEDRDLSLYFNDLDGQYSANRMYVSLYGDSEYISSRDDAVNPGRPGNVGIVLKNETIHDVEIGYKAYGGYSMGASGIVKKSSTGTQRAAMPILIPEVIVKYLINNQDLPKSYEEKTSQPRGPSILRNKNDIEPIVLDFQQTVTRSFGDLLAFGFVFGSAAKGKLKVKGDDCDDLDTFVCLKNESPETEAIYLEELKKLHYKYNLKVDDVFPAEIMTLETLKEAISRASKHDVSIWKPIEGQMFDDLFWVHSLTDKKTGFIGDGKLMSSLIKSAQSNIYRWQKQIIAEIKGSSTLPLHLHSTFSGLGKDQIIEKMEKMPPHLVVHLGLNYINENNKKFDQSIQNSIQAQKEGMGFFQLPTPGQSSTTPVLPRPGSLNT
ncbi:aldehyde dehydrogenase family protein [Legionella quinlivanii]|uniref:aldehyde dehydrogenase family protein n=1 Tax=Legionella quinlivanii TaxID=45073 RepID=UPI0022444B1D|nr:aldehyde dehydrogenase family protein [Legionella quinlivanii]MCW8452586.1 aldehyde dehydrogenase family protein [Legionella quinlivanii]